MLRYILHVVNKKCARTKLNCYDVYSKHLPLHADCLLHRSNRSCAKVNNAFLCRARTECELQCWYTFPERKMVTEAAAKSVARRWKPHHCCTWSLVGAVWVASGLKLISTFPKECKKSSSELHISQSNATSGNFRHVYKPQYSSVSNT